MCDTHNFILTSDHNFAVSRRASGSLKNIKRFGVKLIYIHRFNLFKDLNPKLPM